MTKYHSFDRYIKGVLLACGIFIQAGLYAQDYGFNAYKENGKYGIKYHGAVSVYPRYDSLILSTYNNKIAGGYLQNGKWGIIINGTRTSPPVFEAVSGSLNHLIRDNDIFAVSDGFRDKIFIIAVKEHGKWGYADAFGNYIIEPQYDKVSDFSQWDPHYAVVQRGDSIHYINMLNQVVSKDIGDIAPDGVLVPNGWKALQNVKKSAESKIAKDKADTPKRQELITQLKAQYEKALEAPASRSESGVSKVQEGEKWRIVAAGNQPVSPNLYDDVMQQEGGVFRVVSNNRYGLVDAESGEIVPCAYDYITEFDDNGKAEVWNADMSGHISKHGHVDIEENLIGEALGKQDMERVNAFQKIAQYNPYNLIIYTYLGSAYYDAGLFTDSYKAYDYAFEQAKAMGIEKQIRNQLFAETRRETAYRQANGIQTPSQSGWDLAIELIGKSMDVYNSIQNIKTDGQAQTAAAAGTVGGGNYEAQYKRWENLAERRYNSLTNTGVRITSSGEHSGKSGAMSGGNYVQQKKALREAQRQMTNIRTKAAQSGVNIARSQWETATVN